MLEQPAFGMRLKALRLERGLSQSALAEDGMSTGYLSRLESGARPPTERAVEYLARRLGVPVSAFETADAPTLAQILAAVTSADGNDETLAGTLADALDKDDKHDPALRWQALWLLARIHDSQGRHSQQLELLTELAALSDDMGVTSLRARARTQLSRCVRNLGDNNQARLYAEEAHKLAADLPASDQAAALHALVSAEAEAGRLAEARAHADDLADLTSSASGTVHVEALWASATVRIRQGDYAGAQQVLETALQGLDSRDDLTLWMRLQLAAASLYLQITPPLTEEAATALDDVAPVLSLIGTDLHKQQMLTLRAHLSFEVGDVHHARELVEQIDEQDLRLSFRDRIRFQALRAQLLILEGDVDGGTSMLQRLAKLAEDALNVELAAEIWRTLATTLTGAYDANPTR